MDAHEDDAEPAAAPAAPQRAVDGRALSAKGERTRKRLLDAAEQVFADLGYHEASIVKITEAAGVAQGTFYRYFASKQAVFDELIRDLNSRVRRAMSEGAARGRTRAEKERYGFEGYFRFTAEHPALYRVIRQAEFVSPRMLEYHYARIVEGYRDGLTTAMNSGEITENDPDVLAWALMGVGEMIGLRWILWHDRSEVPTEILDALMLFVARGLGTEPADSTGPGAS